MIMIMLMINRFHEAVDAFIDQIARTLLIIVIIFINCSSIRISNLPLEFLNVCTIS